VRPRRVRFGVVPAVAVIVLARSPATSKRPNGTTQLELNSVEASAASARVHGTNTSAGGMCEISLSGTAAQLDELEWSDNGAGRDEGRRAPAPSTISVPLSPADSHTNRGPCENVTFAFTFSATAYYTDPTTTGVSASPSPASEGAPITITTTASVTSGTASKPAFTQEPGVSRSCRRLLGGRHIEIYPDDLEPSIQPVEREGTQIVLRRAENGLARALGRLE
jgi:hypothetical protein